MRNKRIIVGFFIWFLTGIPGFASEAVNSDTPFIWWAPGTGGRLADGRFEQIVTLHILPMLAVGKPEAWLRITTTSGFMGTGGAREVFWQKGEWSLSDPMTLIIHSGEYAVADVFARVEIDGKQHFAQITFILYGQTAETEKEPRNLDSAENSSEGPAWPEFRVRSNAEFYWPQTGHEFSVNFNGEAADDWLEVRGENGELLDVINGSENSFTYTPAHDPALNRLGPTAAKPVIFVTRNGEGGSASFTQMVHRSRFGGMNKRAGVTVFAVSFLLSGLTAWLARRRAQPCS